VLTLFTTPVIYLAFDRLAQRFNKKDDASATATAAPDHGPHGNPAPEST
jgi:multidrug efflux pump